MRVSFLCSLAQIRAELQTLTFEKIGMPLMIAEGNTAGSSYHGTNEDDIDKAVERSFSILLNLHPGIPR